MPVDQLEKRLSRNRIDANLPRSAEFPARPTRETCISFFRIEIEEASLTSKEEWRRLTSALCSVTHDPARDWPIRQYCEGDPGTSWLGLGSTLFDHDVPEHIWINSETVGAKQPLPRLQIPPEIVTQLRELTQLHGPTLIYAAVEMVSSGYAEFSSPESPKHDFLSRANQLASRGYIDTGIDIVYDAVDEMLRHGEFPRVDAILTETQPKEYSIDIMLALLTSTLPATHRLPARRAFYDRFETWLKTAGEYEDGLLTGLEG